MKDGFLEYYRTNLEHLRELSAEFARQNPKIASRLDMSQQETRDPFVERLLEGAAFLSARVEQKFDDGYPLFLQSLLQKLCPLMAVPLPSGTVLELQKKSSSSGTLSLPGDCALDVMTGASDRAVRYTTLWKESIVPGEITEAACLPILDGELGPEEIRLRGSRSALRLTLDFPGIEDSESYLPDDIDIFLNMPDSDASQLAEALEHGLAGVYLKDGERTVRLEGIVPQLRLFAEKRNLLEQALRVMPGVSALLLFFTYPFLLHFMRLKGLGRALRSSGAGRAVILLCFDRDIRLVRSVSAENVRLNCAAALNLFRFRSDRVRLGMSREFLCEPVRTGPLNYEICSLDSLELFDGSNRSAGIARPFYSMRGLGDTEEGAVFFSMRRAKRKNGLYRRRSSYVKTDVFIALSGGGYSAADGRFSEFSAEGWATNADLPLFIRTGSAFTSPSGACGGTALVPPTDPREPLMMRGSADSFTRLSYVLLNLSAFMSEDGGTCLSMLRQLTGAYFPGGSSERRSLEDGIWKAESRPEVFRFVQQGCVYFEKGYALELTLDEQKLAGVGLYAFGRVLAEAVRDYCPVNLLMRITLSGRERGRICQWTPGNV